MNRALPSLLLAFSVLLLPYPANLLAQEAPTLASIDQLLEEVSANTDLDEQASAEMTAQLEAARKQLEAEAGFLQRAEQLAAAGDSAPQDTARFQQQLAEAQEAAGNAEPEVIDTDASLQDLESQITLLDARRQGLAQRRNELRATLDNWPERRTSLQKRLVELKSQQEEVRASEDIPGNLQERVAATVAASRNRAWQAEQQALEAELLSNPTRIEVISAESAWLTHSIELLDQQLQALNSAAEAARSSAAQEKLESSAALQEKTSNLAPQLQAYATANRDLAEQLQKYATENDQATRDAREMQEEFERIEQDYSLMRRRLEAAGRKDALGRVMITRLDNLPNTDLIRRDIRYRNDRVADLSLVYIDIDEELRQISGSRRYAEQLLADIDPEDQASRDLVNQLVQQRQQLLDSGQRNLRDLLQTLLSSNETAGNLIIVTDEFHRFLVGNLMWVRNFSYVSVPILTQQLAAVLSPTDWLRLPRDLSGGYRQHAWGTALVLLLLLVVAIYRPLRSLYNERLARPALLNRDTLLNILLCLALLAVLVLPAPLLLYVCGVLLAEVQPSTVFLEALAPSLEFLSRWLYVLLLARELLSPMGVGRRLLKWDSRMLESIRRETQWAAPAILAALLLDLFAINLDVVASGGPLGAITTATVAGCIIAVCWRLLKQELFQENRNLRLFLRLCVVLPAFTVLMLLLGLLFAAEIYLAAICLTILVILGIKTLADVLERALLILRARLERKAKEELRALEEEGEDSELEVEDLVDVVSLSEAHDKLLSLLRLLALGIALWWIWSPSLPAFTMLESVSLWQVKDSADPTGALRTVTLMDLSMGVVIIILTALIAKHLPSLVQIFLLEWVNISAGARYASSVLMQYVVVAIGGSMFLATVGWDWSQLQWLVAALGVGIGFGLQEIVANFISGIIILFERPIRVGDIISVGGAEGKVTNISARATVLQTFEGKEHLIPNKELITGQVINWSLSENAVRVVIPVGIAYGSDVRQAMKLLLEAAREVPLVLVEPEPMATFEDFGDNSLLLWLRCYVSEERPRAWTELRTVINDKFNEAGIVISFPQRDVHLDVQGPLRIAMESDFR